MTTIKRTMVLLSLLLCVFASANAQFTYSAGRIVYERKTNLYKRFKDREEIKKWIKEEDKIKIDSFEMFFNDTMSAFKPLEAEIGNDYMSWVTRRNTVYQNFKTGVLLTQKDVFSEKVNLKDSLRVRKWIITDSKRNISGYNCRKAIWKVDDSTRIYAWYTDALVVSTGPESFNGLPGVILGLATEDGGVVYFAKKVELVTPVATAVALPKMKKVSTTSELKAELEKQYGKQDWFKASTKDMFGIW